MSMTSTTNSVKQRKLSDLRVADLQRELRSFNISYDKKELKGSLLEKLRQVLLNRNLDPDTHLFDTSIDLKSISSDENNRNYEENGSHDPNILETSTMEIDSDQHLHIENPEQTNPTSPSQTSTTTSTINDINDDQTNRMDTIGFGETVDVHANDNIFLTIDQSTTKQEDEYSNDNIDRGLIQVSCSSSDEESDTKNQIPSSTNKKSIPTTTEKSISSDHNHGEGEQGTTPLPPPSTATKDLSTDNDNISKSAINRQESSDEPQKKENTNKDQCHLWVSNIAKETHASDLKALFSKYGKVFTTKVIGSSSSQWFGYINLATPDDVEKCINALHQTELHGKKIYVDREMHDQTSHSSSSKSKSNSGSSSSNRHTSSNTHRKQSDQSNHKSSSSDSHKKRDSITAIQVKSSLTDTNASSKKRSASTSSENKKKLSTSDVKKPNNGEKSVKLHDTDSSIGKSTESNNAKRRTSSSSSNSQSSKPHVSRTDVPRTSEKSESSHKSTTNNRKNDKHSNRSERSSTHSTDISKSKISPPVSNRSHSNEKHSIPSLTKSDHHRSSSIDKSKQRTSSHLTSTKYEKPKETFSKDIHRPTASNTFDNDRRTVYQNEQRLRHEKEILVHKQYVQQQEEEKIKEQQRRLAEERDRMRREFEFLERERLEIERTRMVLEKEKQDQARELGKQQRRLADEAKHRQQQVDAKLRDEKLHRLSNNDNKRPRSAQYDLQRPHYSNANNGSNNNSNKGYDHRSSTNTTSGRGRDRPVNDTSRDYYPESKRQYTNNTNNPREAIFRDRVVYRESDLPSPASGLGLSASSSMTSSNNNQRYLPGSSNQHRPSDPYNALPQRGRDMALPPTSSVSSAYERSSRNTGASPTNTNAILRRPHSRERFDDREYMQQAQRRDRSPPPPPPPPANTLRREAMETAHWERPKPRDGALYVDDSHKYLPNQYLSEASQSAQQQGLWSAAPPSRQQQQQQHHHADLSVKTVPHGSVVDPYNWQHVSQQVPPSSHHPQGLSSSHDRPHSNVINNQRIPILSSNQPPPPPPSSRGGTAGQTHLYSHPGVPVGTLSSSQQHTSLIQPPPPPPTSLHHTTSYVTQQAPPPGLVLHPTGQTRAYEQHYVVTQPLPQRRY